MPRDANGLGRLGMDCLNRAASALKDDNIHTCGSTMACASGCLRAEVGQADLDDDDGR